MRNAILFRSLVTKVRQTEDAHRNTRAWTFAFAYRARASKCSDTVDMLWCVYVTNPHKILDLVGRTPNGRAVRIEGGGWETNRYIKHEQLMRQCVWLWCCDISTTFIVLIQSKAAVARGILIPKCLEFSPLTFYSQLFFCGFSTKFSAELDSTLCRSQSRLVIVSAVILYIVHALLPHTVVIHANCENRRARAPSSEIQRNKSNGDWCRSCAQTNHLGRLHFFRNSLAILTIPNRSFSSSIARTMMIPISQVPTGF